LHFKILAVGDVHGYKYLPLFRASVSSLLNIQPKLIIFAGDMVDEGNVLELRPIVNIVTRKFSSIKIIAVFGNEEYHELEDRFIKEYPEILWLNDSYTIVDINGVKLGIVGSRGSLERLTFWQRRNKPELEKVYKERPLKIKEMLLKLKTMSDVTILVTHYAPTFITVYGEPFKVYPYMGSRDFERVIKEAKPNIVIHAHAHNSRVVEASIGLSKIYNVSLPARKGVTLIDINVIK